MPDPLYSDRWTQLFTVTPGPGQIQASINSGTPESIPYISGFMVDVDGTVTVVGKESGQTVTLTVLAGWKYDIACKQVIAVGGGVTTVIGGR
jgi:hypothetical protein